MSPQNGLGARARSAPGVVELSFEELLWILAVNPGSDGHRR